MDYHGLGRIRILFGLPNKSCMHSHMLFIDSTNSNHKDSGPGLS